MFVGSASLGCNANPLTNYLLWPITCWEQNMQKLQFEAILTPKLHRTASCTLKKGLHGTVHQYFQKGGKGGSQQGGEKYRPTAKF